MTGRRAWHEETFPACTFVLERLLDELIPVACRKTGKGVDGTRQHHEHDTGPGLGFLPYLRQGVVVAVAVATKVANAW